MKEDKLKPCPFCGPEGKINGPHESGNYRKTTFWIECERCEIYLEKETRAEVIEAWNTRSDQTEEEACNWKYEPKTEHTYNDVYYSDCDLYFNSKDIDKCFWKYCPGCGKKINKGKP